MRNTNQPAFAPGGATVNITAGTTSGRVQVQATNMNRHIRVFNSGAEIAFLAFGDSAAVATTSASMPVPAGNTEIFSCPHPYVAAITTTGTSVVYITPGEGL